MNKKEIIRKLNESGLNKKHIWVVAGSSMVMHEIKDNTNDIDLGCTKEYADYLQNKGYKTILLEDGLRKIIFDDDIEMFENWLFDKVEIIDDIPVISIRGLCEMKQNLGREKDLRDLELISVFLEN